MGQLCLKILIPYLENPSEETIWDEVFRNGPSQICGREPKKFEVIWSTKQTISLPIF